MSMRPRFFDSTFWTPRAVAFSLGAMIFTFTLLAAVGVSSAQSPVSEDRPSSSGSYQLGPGDVIRVTVLKQDLLLQDGVRIGNDGKIRLLMLDGPVQAACLTESELAASITERYRKYLLNPQVYVSVREFNANTVAVIGAVNSPGRFQLQRPVRLLEILTFVNGPSAAASDELQILRASARYVCGENKPQPIGMEAADESEPEIISLALNDVLEGTSDSNPFLRGGDIIRITQAEQRQAYILGSVAKATTVDLKDPVGLSTAIAMAGGALSGSKIDKIKITRQDPGSLSKKDLYVNLKEIRDGSRAEFLLQHNDIVEVPGPSGTKKFFKDVLRSIVPVFTRTPVLIP